MGSSPSRSEPIGHSLGMLHRLTVAVKFQLGFEACPQGIDRRLGCCFVRYGRDLRHLGVLFGIEHGGQHDAGVIEDGFGSGMRLP